VEVYIVKRYRYGSKKDREDAKERDERSGETGMRRQMTDDRPFEWSFPRRRESRLHWIPAFAGMTVVMIILLDSGF
jgi:hypothetical protein